MIQTRQSKKKEETIALEDPNSISDRASTVLDNRIRVV
jgi:hypothetical protein